MAPDRLQPQRTSVPTPDPTVFSKELVDKEINHLRELLESRMDGSARLTEERFRTIGQQVQAAEQVAGEQRHTLGTRIESLKERMDRGDGRFSGQTALIAGLIALATLALGVLVYLKH